MKKLFTLLTLSIFPTLVINAQTQNLEITNAPNNKVMEMHQALERSKEAFKETKNYEPKAVNAKKYEADRAEFWRKVEHKKAKYNTTPAVISTEDKPSDGLINRAVEAIFNLFR